MVEVEAAAHIQVLLGPQEHQEELVAEAMEQEEQILQLKLLEVKILVAVVEQTV
jgi:hypothetical protein